MAAESPAPTKMATPSMAPSWPPNPVLAVELFNIAIVLDGFPFINATNMRNVTSENRTLWETITSYHVSSYWAQRNYTDFNITTVTTLFQTQVNFFTDQKPLANEVTNRTKIVYDQQVMYMVKGQDSPIASRNETNQTRLFLQPFDNDSQRYADSLQKAFDLPNRINMHLIRLIATPPPSTSPGDGDLTDEDGLDSGTIAAISLACFFFVAFAFFFGIWCKTRRKEGHVKKAEFFSEPGAMVVVEELPDLRAQNSEFSNYDPAVSEAALPAIDEANETDQDDQRLDRKSSLHVGILLDDEVLEDLLSAVNEDGHHSEEDSNMFSVSATQRQSVSGFGLKIIELED